ncbi:MAG TPA: carboxypeptidase-like regulatory domain-containing protein [Candidatus Acidoferrales bacterium]|nr:carboxypeptidase-like regulatory domain-containing protein [Candidatus Acidoferrales bacterium]
MDGGGRDVEAGYHYNSAYFGQSAEYAFVGGYAAGFLGLDATPELLGDSMFTTPILVWPLHFSQGQYNLAAYTYGYIQDKDFSAYAMNGQVADMKINLIIGVNVSLDVLFKKESIITGTPYNMSARVRLFNDQGQLVAEWMSSEGTYVDRTGHAIAANGELPSTASGLCPSTDEVGSGCSPLYPFNNAATFSSSGLIGYNFLPGGVTLLHVLMAGLPQQPPPGNLATGTFFGDPIATEVPVAAAISPAEFYGAYFDGFGPVGQFGGCDFQLNCYPAPYGQYAFPYAGIAGAPDYTGGWTAEVDFVPWYTNNTIATVNILCEFEAFPSSCGGQYYPPVNGLLMGESYHIIPGTTATSTISLTEDMALSSAFLGHSLVANHLGPYSQEGVWQIAGTHNSGEASGIFEVDLNGLISGNVLAFTWSNEFRTLSWGTISVTGAPGGATWNFYTYDGIYQAFLPTDNYKFTIAQPGYAPQTWSVSVSPGETGTGQNVYLEQSNIPVPEFSGGAVVAFSAVAASVYVLKRKRK